MEKRSQAQGDVIERLRSNGGDEGSGAQAGTGTLYHYEIAQRSAGMKPGTYVVTCNQCKGQGMSLVRGMSSLYEICLQCDGEGGITVNGERWGDSNAQHQPSWGDVLSFMAIAALVTAISCGLIIWAANAVKP